MKKAVVLIAALLMVGSLAFAAPSFGIWGRTVFQLAGNPNTDNDPIYQGWGPNWGGQGPRMGVHTTFSTDKLEFKVTLYYNGAATNPQDGALQNVDIVNMYGTVKFIPDLFSLIVGKMSGDGFDTYRLNTAHPTADMQNNNVGRMSGWGMVFVVAPKDSGFDAALRLKTPEPNGSLDSGYRIENQLKNISVAASYKLPDLLKVSAGFVSEAAFDNAGTNNSAYNIFARVHLLAVPNLTLWADGRLYGFEAEQLDMAYLLYAGYKLDALEIFLGVAFGIDDQPSPVDSIMSLTATLEVTYNLGFLTLGGVFIFDDGNLDVDGMNLRFRVYGLLNDFAVRLAFELSMNNVGTDPDVSTMGWAIPVYFTFSIW